MTALFEPNLHPLVVHFAIAFLVAGPAFLLIAAMRPHAQKGGIQAAGDWMFTLGLVSALIAVGAGLQAYYSVPHDGPSHAAMTDHRNWALVTTGSFTGFGIWRYLRRKATPSVLFSFLLLVPVALLGVTGWKGGHLVYHYGLGVANLPVVSGDGHDHEHAGGEVHAEQPVIHERPGADAGVHTPPQPAPHLKEQELPKANEHDHSTHDH